MLTDWFKAIAPINAEAISKRMCQIMTRTDRACLKVEEGRDFDDTIDGLTEAIRLDPTLAMAYCLRGEAYYGQNYFDNAIDDYNEALRLDPKCSAAYRSRGHAYLFNGDFDKAIVDFNEALRLNPDDKAAWFGHSIATAKSTTKDRRYTIYIKKLKQAQKARR